MGTQYFCKSERRRQEVRDRDDLGLNGIDYLEVLDQEAIPLGSPRQRTLLVRCIRALDPAVSASNVEIHGGVRVKPITVEWAGRAADAATLFADGLIDENERDFLLAQREPENLLVVRTDSEGDYSTYRLCLVTGDDPLVGFDPPLAEVDFSFKVECPSDFDCAPQEICPPELEAAPPIDYLAKDYASFRRLMLDRLSVVMPEWKERSPADVGIALVEVLAYAADHLSYYQDAVATEAYLNTARRRPSVRRHAQLLDYPMHDGCNARVWVVVRAEAGVKDVLLLRVYSVGGRTSFLTRVPGEGTAIAEEDLARIVAEHGPRVFEPMFDLRLYDVHNDLFFYTWGDEECCLPKGATRATLRDFADDALRLRLRPGDVLVFEEALSPATGQAAEADPTRRHAVRLTRVEPEAQVDESGVRTPGPLKTDDLFEQPIVEIEWDAADALPFPLCLSARIEQDGEDVLFEDMSVAHGNVVLADHGRTVPTEPLKTPTGDRRYRPGLEETHITQRVRFSAEDWETIPAGDPRWLSAAEVIALDPREALPVIELLSAENEDWKPERDLLASDRFDPDFVVETESDGRAALRFGDNIFGRTPEAGVSLDATYRVGVGPAGNVGAEAIAHVLTTPGIGIEKVCNPLPATGGTAPESLDEVRLYAPQAFRTQERAVTEDDYAAVAERHPEVSRAIARRLWTGSWHTMFITVDRLGGREVDWAFEEELSRFIERFQLASHDVEIEPPRFVPLDIALRVCVEPGHLRSDLKQALLETFSSHDLPDGRRGFFHPDNLTFDQPVYLSQVLATAMEVPGVRWVEVDETADPPGRFQRWGENPRGEIAMGYIDIGRLEIAQLDNDPNAPENGKIEFHMEGGL